MRPTTRRGLLAGGIALLVPASGCLSDGDADDERADVSDDTAPAASGDGVGPDDGAAGDDESHAPDDGADEPDDEPNVDGANETWDGLPDPLADLQPFVPADADAFGTYFYASQANADYGGTGQAFADYAIERAGPWLRETFGVEPSAVHSESMVRRAGEAAEEHVVLGSFDEDAVVDRLLADDGPAVERAGSERGFQLLTGAGAHDYAVRGSAVLQATALEPYLDAYHADAGRLLAEGGAVAELLGATGCRNRVGWTDATSSDVLPAAVVDRYAELGVSETAETDSVPATRRVGYRWEEPPTEAQVADAASYEELGPNATVVRQDVSGTVGTFDVDDDRYVPPSYVQWEMTERFDEPREGYVTIRIEHGGGQEVTVYQGAMVVSPRPDDHGPGYDPDGVTPFREGDAFEVSYELGATVDRGDRVTVDWVSPDGGDPYVSGEHVIGDGSTAGDD